MINKNLKSNIVTNAIPYLESNNFIHPFLFLKSIFIEVFAFNIFWSGYTFLQYWSIYDNKVWNENTQIEKLLLVNRGSRNDLIFKLSDLLNFWRDWSTDTAEALRAHSLSKESFFLKNEPKISFKKRVS